MRNLSVSTQRRSAKSRAQSDAFAAECPHCGQKMLILFGVRFPPKKAEILDMIANVTEGRGGIEAEALGWVFYPGVAKRVATSRIKSHVLQINDLLAETEWKIENRDGLYRLRKEAT